MATTPKHCPGFEQVKNLKSFLCRSIPSKTHFSV